MPIIAKNATGTDNQAAKMVAFFLQTGTVTLFVREGSPFRKENVAFCEIAGIQLQKPGCKDS